MIPIIMAEIEFHQFFKTTAWFHENQGPRYMQLFRHLSEAAHDGRLPVNTQLPPEREIAALADVSRVTVRKAIAKLVSEGTVAQQQGSGSFIRKPSGEKKLEHTLSTLTSFTEYMRLRGIVSGSKVLARGLFSPTPTEIFALGLRSEDKVARIRRLRTADNVPMAVEHSSLPSDILPRPQDVGTSLYDVLRVLGVPPVRAVQRISAKNLDQADAELMDLPVGSAVLLIDRTGYNASGRPIEFTRGIYRSDIYDFVAELRLEDRE